MRMEWEREEKDKGNTGERKDEDSAITRFQPFRSGLPASMHSSSSLFPSILKATEDCN